MNGLIFLSTGIEKKVLHTLCQQISSSPCSIKIRFKGILLHWILHMLHLMADPLPAKTFIHSLSLYSVSQWERNTACP